MVAIVGRPNVGKSSLLNCLARQRISIVEPTAGVTRDRVTAVIEHDDRYFELVDTGGFGIDDHDNLTAHVEGQIQYAIAGASLILFVVDVLTDLTPLDGQVAQLLRTVDRPVLVVANKAEATASLIDLASGEVVATLPTGRGPHEVGLRLLTAGKEPDGMGWSPRAVTVTSTLARD